MEGEALAAATFISVMLVPFVSLIKKPTWSHQAKYALGLAAALVAAFAGAVIDGNVNSVSDFSAYFGTAFAAAQTLYNLYFTDSSMNERLENM